MSDRSTAMRWARWFAVLVIVTIGSAAFALSFAALQELAVMARTPESLAWLWPVIVDGTIIQATVSALVLANSPERRWFLWVLAAGALVSITGNSVHAALADGGELPWWAAALVAAVAPISLLVDTHGLALLFRASQRSPEPATATGTAVEALEAVEPGESRPEPVVTAPEKPKPGRRPAKQRRDPEQVARAVAMRAEGRSYAEIGKALGVSATTAANYAAKTTRPAPDPAPEPEPVTASTSPSVPVASVRPAPVVRPVSRVLPVRPVRPAQQVLPIAVPARGM